MSLIIFRFFRSASQPRFTILLLVALLGAPAFGQTRSGTDILLSAQDRLSVADTVRGILSYARWPTEPNPLRLCVTGRSVHADTLLAHGLSPLGTRAVTVSRMPADTEVSAQCDALYVGHLEETGWRHLFAQIAGRPVLTLCERSPACATGGMFCLDVDDVASIPFEVNLDSVARSGVRVNPQVLRLGRRTAKGTS